MHDTFRDAFAIEALQFLDECGVLQEHGAGRARRLRILVVADGGTRVSREFGGLGDAESATQIAAIACLSTRWEDEDMTMELLESDRWWGSRLN